RALPFLQQRIGDPNMPDDSLSPVERIARERRNELLRDHGGEHVSAVTRMKIDSIVGLWIIDRTLSQAVLRMAAEVGLLSRTHRRVFPAALEYVKVAGALSASLAALGERFAPKHVSLDDYVRERYGARPEPSDDVKET